MVLNDGFELTTSHGAAEVVPLRTLPVETTAAFPSVEGGTSRPLLVSHFDVVRNPPRLSALATQFSNKASLAVVA